MTSEITENVPAKPCHRCAAWGDGVADPDDTARWRTCKVDGLNHWAHRDYACGRFAKAPTLREAVRAAPPMHLTDGAR